MATSVTRTPDHYESFLADALAFARAAVERMTNYERDECRRRLNSTQDVP